MTEKLNDEILSYAVSSILNRDTKQYGKKFLFDGEDDTCWNSDQGDSQHISLKFNSKITISRIEVQFQGGFSSKQIDLLDLANDQNILTSLYPEDVNNNQIFELEKPVSVTMLKLNLLKPTDMFGRMIVYNLNIYGLK
eukprot:TCONS_00025993-protein